MCVVWRRGCGWVLQQELCLQQLPCLSRALDGWTVPLVHAPVSVLCSAATAPAQPLLGQEEKSLGKDRQGEEERSGAG